MTQADISALLGRPLTSIEDTNFKTYLKIATQELEDLLCITLCDSDEDSRVFDASEGYRTVFADIFTEVTEVKVDGEVKDSEDYSVRQWDKRSGRWYNSLVFDTKFREDAEVEITADWGFGSTPLDLRLLIARLFDEITKQNTLDRTINSKKVEDFSISYNHSGITLSDTIRESLVKDNATTFKKYSMCDIRTIRSGKVYHGYRVRPLS